jgi:hypothetical protein
LGFTRSNERSRRYLLSLLSGLLKRRTASGAIATMSAPRKSRRETIPFGPVPKQWKSRRYLLSLLSGLLKRRTASGAIVIKFRKRVVFPFGIYSKYNVEIKNVSTI